MGVSFSEASKTLVEKFMKLSTKEQKQAPENSTGVFQTFERRPSRFSRHCEYITS